MCVWGRGWVKGEGTGIQGDSGRLEARGAGDRAQTSMTHPQGWAGPGQEGRGLEGREGGREGRSSACEAVGGPGACGLGGGLGEAVRWCWGARWGTEPTHLEPSSRPQPSGELHVQ